MLFLFTSHDTKKEERTIEPEQLINYISKTHEPTVVMPAVICPSHHPPLPCSGPPSPALHSSFFPLAPSVFFFTIGTLTQRDARAAHLFQKSRRPHQALLWCMRLTPRDVQCNGFTETAKCLRVDEDGKHVINAFFKLVQNSLHPTRQQSKPLFRMIC